MSAVLNGLLARAMALSTPLAGAFSTWSMRRRIRRFARNQALLRARYGITAATPIRPYDDATRAAVHAYVAAHPDARIATTSGSTGRPKELAYPPARLASYKRDSISCGVRAYAHHRVQRPGMFILASLKTDDSFSSLVLHARRPMPPWIAGLVEPSRYLSHPRVAALVDELGAHTVRLWLMTLADPGMLYATNPSTLASFFTELADRWSSVAAALRRFVDGDLAHDRVLARITRRVAAPGWRSRLQLLASAAVLPPVSSWMPGLSAYCTWDGGYVTAFLPLVHRFLPPDAYAHVPMYSMSTETIETLTWFEDGAARFLPLGPEVLYELLPDDDSAPDGGGDDPARLIAPGAAVPGGVYTLVVSDPWGLVRYQTDDLFRCDALVHGLPDLRFVRRRGLAHSFTGEKLTGEQVVLAFAELRAGFGLGAGVELAIFPSHAADAPMPRYQLVVAPTGDGAVDVDLDALARAFDDACARLNAELAQKRASGRLAAPRASIVRYALLAAALDTRTRTDADVAQRAWESQFKLNPLMKARWEDVEARLKGSGGTDADRDRT